MSISINNTTYNLKQEDENLSKTQETVEVIIELPKRLMDVLEGEDYFGWSKQDFFAVSIQRSISCETSEMSSNEVHKLRKKYGFKLDVIKYNEKKTLVFP
jgi:hypothetical protein